MIFDRRQMYFFQIFDQEKPQADCYINTKEDSDLLKDYLPNVGKKQIHL